MKLLGIFLMIGSISCVSDDMPVACEVSAAEDLPWLAEKIRQIDDAASDFDRQYAYVNLGWYKSQRVVIFRNCCPFCNYIPQAYTCDGALLSDIEWTGDNAPTGEELWWAHEDSTCQH